MENGGLPSGKRSRNYGISPCLMGKSTISTGPFSIAILNYQRAYKHTLYISLCPMKNHHCTDINEKYLSPIPTHPMPSEGLLRILWLGNVRSGTDDLPLGGIQCHGFSYWNRSSKRVSSCDSYIYIYTIVIPNKMEK